MNYHCLCFYIFHPLDPSVWIFWLEIFTLWHWTMQLQCHEKNQIKYIVYVRVSRNWEIDAFALNLLKSLISRRRVTVMFSEMMNSDQFVINDVSRQKSSWHYVIIITDYSVIAVKLGVKITSYFVSCYWRFCHVLCWGRKQTSSERHKINLI